MFCEVIVTLNLFVFQLLLLSVLACGYAAKLDRTYLPPPGAAAAGGSPGALNAPSGPASGPSSFGQSANLAQGTFEQSQQSFGLNQPGKGFNQPTNNYGQAAQPQGQPGFGAQPQKLTQGPSAGQGAYGAAPAQGAVANVGFGATSNFGADQGFAKQTAQPERPQAAADRSAEILKLVNENDGENFSYSFETSNGISAEESGVATNGVMAQGAFAYTGDDGQSYRVTYTADENGYQPRGDHLPTPPPIPEEILRSIEKNAAAAAAGIQEGAYREEENESVPQQYNAQQNTGSASQYNAQSNFGSSQQYNAQQSAGQYNAQQTAGQYNAPAQSKPFSAPSSAYSQAPQNNYNKPSGSATTSFSASGTGQNSFSQTGSSQSAFAPSGSAPSGPAQSSFAPAGPAQNAFTPSGSAQSSFAPSRPTQNAFAPTGPSQNAFAPSAQYNQAQTQGFKKPTAQNTFAAQQQGASGYEYNRPGSSEDSFRGPSQSVAPAVETFAPGQQTFGGRAPAPSKLTENPISSRPAGPAQGSFNSQQPTNNGFQARPASQGFAQSAQYNQQQSSMMSQYLSAPYQYDAPKQQYRPESGSSPQQTAGFNAPAQYNQGTQGGQTFGAPRQPPSFSQDEGYKY
ncbi:hypothetical protein JYU34_014109 [Plutella xylostella]|uniref:Uncharacterized protein n=1 Tax=Plutella xylostella TaxID=51655 RepID=A0ABQ7Q7K8_PLUXY|nr:hypothetical protein JYU34_014109 [Plutella xylostella]